VDRVLKRSWEHRIASSYKTSLSARAKETSEFEELVKSNSQQRLSDSTAHRDNYMEQPGVQLDWKFTIRGSELDIEWL
jgi:hypothetical protein